MKRKVKILLIASGVLVSGLALGYNSLTSDCPLEGTEACPKTNCPLKGTPECPYGLEADAELPSCCQKK